MIDLDKIVAEYKKQKEIGKGKPNLDKNLQDGVCVELIRQWLSFGIGPRKTMLKSAGVAKREKKAAYIKAMLNRMERYWIEFCRQTGVSDHGYFKRYLSSYLKKLYAIWIDEPVTDKAEAGNTKIS